MARIQARKALPTKLKALSFKALYQQRIEPVGSAVHCADIEAHLIYNMHEMAPKLSRSIEAPFYLEKCADGMAKIRCTKIGQLLMEIAGADFVKLRLDWPVHEFSPIVNGFMKFQKLVPKRIFPLKANFNSLLPLKIAEEIMELANRLALALRKYLKRPAIRSAKEGFGRSALDNFEELIWILQWISEEHTEVVILRFDTHYREEGAKPYELGNPPRIEHLDEYRECRERFHRWIRDKFGDDLLLNAWALEYGRETAFHHHYLLVLKPRGNDDHVGLVDEIGRKWSAITKSLGSIHNGNEHRNDQRYPALGLVRLDHQDVITGLHYIVSYITLAGVYVKLDLEETIKAHGKGGNYPEESPITKLGRPSSRRSPIPIAITHAQALSRYVNFL